MRGQAYCHSLRYAWLWRSPSDGHRGQLYLRAALVHGHAPHARVACDRGRSVSGRQWLSILRSRLLTLAGSTPRTRRPNRLLRRCGRCSISARPSACRCPRTPHARVGLRGRGSIESTRRVQPAAPVLGTVRWHLDPRRSRIRPSSWSGCATRSAAAAGRVQRLVAGRPTPDGRLALIPRLIRAFEPKGATAGNGARASAYSGAL